MRGYIAVEVEYPGNQWHGDMLNYVSSGCEGLEEKARAIFGHSGSRHATYRLCAKERANCSNGIAVAGWSQGSQVASWAARINSNVSAVLNLAHFSWIQESFPGFEWMGLDFPCMRNHGNKEKRLQIVSEDDELVPKPLKQQKETTGYDCGDD